MPSYIEVTIKKPLYGSFVYIRDKYIRQAKLHNVPLKITIPQGSALVSPEDWLKDAQIMKKVFLQPDNPMILYGNRVPINTEKKGTVSKPHLEKGEDFNNQYELIPEDEDPEEIVEQLKLF